MSASTDRDCGGSDAKARASRLAWGNPIGEAVVWYVHHGGAIIISCFVPADAV